MIHWPMTPEQTAKVGLPIVPRSKVDPTRSAKQVSAMFRDIEDRYLGIKRALKALFDQRLTGREREVNSHNWHFLCHVNGASQRSTRSTPASSSTTCQRRNWPTCWKRYRHSRRLPAGRWRAKPLGDGLRRRRGAARHAGGLQQPLAAVAGVRQPDDATAAFKQPRLSEPDSGGRLTTFSDWKVISDTARGDLTNIITDAVARGVNPRETASVISKRLDVSMSKAKTIAQTEQVGALRQAQWNETDWAADRLGLNTGLLWLSALKPTTRSWHASRHGKVYTTEQVRDFYAENGNRYNCYCSQIPVLLNDDGSIFNQGLAEKLAKERKQWTG
jgi:SPP1 gp7 family putative phage head morphogenesis protein